jgi:hypothetical protein
MTGDGDCPGGAAKRLNLGLFPQILDRFLPFDVQDSAEGSGSREDHEVLEGCDKGDLQKTLLGQLPLLARTFIDKCSRRLASIF